MKKHTVIFLFLIFGSCKQETVDNKVDTTIYRMWNNFIKENPKFKNDGIPESDFFHNNKKDADRLAELTLNGKKKASSGLLSLYKQYNVDLPKVGTKQIITNFEGKAQAIIEIKSVDTIPFHQISKEYAAMDMGTDIEPLQKWKKAHWDFFSNVMKENGKEPTEHMLIVCEKFEVIWKKSSTFQ